MICCVLAAERRGCVFAECLLRKREETAVVVASEISPLESWDLSSILVVGGGGIGLETFKALSTAGSWVTVYQRSDKFQKDIEGLGAMLALGDVLDPKAIQKTFKSNTFDAVIVTVDMVGATETHWNAPLLQMTTVPLIQRLQLGLLSISV